MWEDQYQVYRRHGDGEYDLCASNMMIDVAVLFVQVYFQNAYNDQDVRFEIRRQPKENQYVSN